jgi:hypothetical protein
MKLLVRRDQKKGMLGMGSIVFQLDARAELSAQEREWVNKYKMGKTLLYNHKDFVDRSSTAMGSFFAAVAHRMTNIQVTVEDLVNGKHIEVKDIVEPECPAHASAVMTR